MTPTYSDVMLEWAVAELMSPHWRTVENWVWTNPAWQPWRDMVRKLGRPAWSPEQSRILIQAVEASRTPIIGLYGPWPSSSFTRQDLTRQDLAGLYVMPEFFPPGGTLLQLLEWVKAKPDYAPEKTASIKAMVPKLVDDVWPFAALIVSIRPDGACTLIEGYKRALASLAAGRQTTPAILVWP